MTRTGLFDIDGTPIMEGDRCVPVRGHFSQKKFKGLWATPVWDAPSFKWLWSDGYRNPVEIMNPGNFRVSNSKA